MQDELLDAAADLVSPGGLLVYSTCSIEAEENDVRVKNFLARAPSYTLEPAPPGLLPDAVVDAAGCLATFPHRHAVDGAYAARLRRSKAEDSGGLAMQINADEESLSSLRDNEI